VILRSVHFHDCFLAYLCLSALKNKAKLSHRVLIITWFNKHMQVFDYHFHYN